MIETRMVVDWKFAKRIPAKKQTDNHSQKKLSTKFSIKLFQTRITLQYNP